MTWSTDLSGDIGGSSIFALSSPLAGASSASAGAALNASVAAIEIEVRRRRILFLWVRVMLPRFRPSQALGKQYRVIRRRIEHSGRTSCRLSGDGGRCARAGGVAMDAAKRPALSK